MRRSRLLPSACLLDAFIGDPEWFLHPVRFMGAVIARAERALRVPGQSPQANFAAGALLTVTVVAGSYLVSDQVLRATKRRSPAMANTVEILLACTCIAARNLQDEATAVLDALEDADLHRARIRLARIVGRDTGFLGEQEICRAVIETLAESLSDGVVAPLLYLALGGVPLAMAYKAVNTLDSMIGHADERYFYFGKLAARLDDVANLLPSRVSAFAIFAAAAILPGCSPRSAFSTWVADGSKHKSPNAGQPESAMAGALKVRLGGANTYAGEIVPAPCIGVDFEPPSLESVCKSVGVVAVAGLLSVLASLCLHLCARKATS